LAGDEIIVDAVYDWIYNDSGSAWGHRDFALSKGLVNNNTDQNSEGLIGIGIASGAYSVFASGEGTVVVMNGFDPSDTWNHGSETRVDTSQANRCN
jgi:hypothetical protein